MPLHSRLPPMFSQNPPRATIGAALISLFLAGCGSVPPTNVHQPMSIRPDQRTIVTNNNGAIFQPNNMRMALFEDRRARYVGDTLVIQINERNTASKKSTTTATRNAADKTGITTLFGVPGKSLQGLGIDAGSKNSLEGKGQSDVNDLISGTLAVTVIDVYPNGNLLVSGEKMMALSQGTEFLRFSGVVNPTTIGPDNAVSSTQVADARIEYKGAGLLSEVQTMGWLQRFFLSVMPF